ncbi:MAG: amidohydrolase family protein [Saprospiraceae bacterium]|nr:amidohydrolase family protein [Saprospiraceae bacterium]
MNVLIKNATIIHKGSKFHLKKYDLLISGGKIQKIQKGITDHKGSKLEGKDLYCCIGLCDIGTHSGEPGFEHRETLHSLSKAALAGGYTSLAVFPNNIPVTQTKADIKYLKEHAELQGVEIWPIGALSKDIKGVDIAEYMDMAAGGAVAFSDGMKSIQNTGLLSRALQYAAQIGGVVIHHPDDHHLSQGGEMHEGEMSTLLGLKGIADIAELHTVQRDILINEYNSGNLIEHCISSERSVSVIKKAKEAQKSLFSTVSYMNLLHTDADMHDFNTNLKVSPVLRSEKDKKALIHGLKNGTIDAIVSNHTPLDEESKNLEFPYAIPGAIGLETCLMACVSGLRDEMDLADIIEKLTVMPRKILNIPIPEIEEGQSVNLCVFEITQPFIFTTSDLRSKSTNSPYVDKEFDVRVLAAMRS